MLIDILIFVAILVALILVHEWGHFFAARRTGMKVEEFGFGFPPRIAGFKNKGTLFSLNALPLGGFVRIFGEDNAANRLKGSFGSKSAAARALVLSAGVLMNFIFAGLLFTFGYAFTGMPELVSDDAAASAGAKIQILSLADKAPAKTAGLRFGDVILALDGVAPKSVDDVQSYIMSRKGEVINFKIKRGEETSAFQVLARADAPANEGPTGISLGYSTLVKYPFLKALEEGFKLAASIVGMIFVWVYQLITGSAAGDFAGPVGIATLTFQLKELGLAYLVRFIGLLSVNLAVINILPLPALDGGRLAFLAIEKITNRKVSPKVEQAIHAAGFVMLILLMVLITIRDISRL